MSFDTAFCYRLTNGFLGAGQSLAVIPDGSGRLTMAATENDDSQFWKLVDRGGGAYALRPACLGDCFSLDVTADGKNTPRLAGSGKYTGQSWTLAPWGDGTYRLTNAFTGPEMLLDVSGDAHQPFLDAGNHTGQHWTLSQLARISQDAAIPRLNPMGNSDQSECATDFSFYVRPQGTVKAVMVFVDFPDCEAGSASASDIADHLLGGGRAQALYHDQSYRQLTLDVTVRADLGWKRMPHPTTQYNFQKFELHKPYVVDAGSLFSPAEVSFSDYAFVMIVAPPNASMGTTSTFKIHPGSGAPSASGEIHLAVTFSADSYANGYMELVHEVGHVFGLPDLYLYDPGTANLFPAGCWDIMSDSYHAVNFLGWHRHKNGWLSPSRITYLSQDTSAWNATLAPLSDSDGLSMVVLAIGDAPCPSKAYVVELAQPVMGSDHTPWGEGVLLYTVDATIPSGCSPVTTIPKKISTSPVYGHLYEAPYLVNDTMSHSEGPASITLKVLRKLGSSYEIEIDYRRQ